jgi:DNA-directed RNA polymerase subunit RPC12/RpoP
MKTNIECPNCTSPAVLAVLPATRLDPAEESIDCTNLKCDETWQCTGCGEYTTDARHESNICRECNWKEFLKAYRPATSRRVTTDGTYHERLEMDSRWRRIK